MTTVHDVVDQAHERSGRLSPADVQGVLFTRAGLGRRGYDEGEVDFFLERVQTELSRLLGEKSSLRDEAAELRGSGATPGVARDEASVQAVKVLSAAQLTADQYVADAESYSKRLSGEARERYERLVDDALSRAKTILDDAESAAHTAALAAGSAVADGQDGGAPDGAPGASREELEQQVAYLRTFSQVCRVQLRAYLEALLSDVEAEWGRADPGVVPAAPARPQLTAPPAAAATPDVPSPAPPADAVVVLDGQAGPPAQPARDNESLARH